MQTALQNLLPHKLISWFAGLCANCKIVWIKNFLINYFIQRYPVNMQEAIEPNPFAYPTYNDFFTRLLKPECRPIDPAHNAIVSPCDGGVAQIGTIQDQTIIQAKLHNYSLNALLGGDADFSTVFRNGSFATLYLAPKDYHRVHMPLSGKLQKMTYVPGKLFSVNTQVTQCIPDLFARNERVITIFETQAGPMAVILVGAMIVGSIETVWAGTITPPHHKTMQMWDYSTSNIMLSKGTELGRFKLGSTVIILLPAGIAKWQDNLLPQSDIKVGQKIGEICET